MEEIKAEDVAFRNTDGNKENKPTDIVISRTYPLENCRGIQIVVMPGNKGFIPLIGKDEKKLYYMTSKNYHYFNLKKIKDWDKIETIVFKRIYKDGDGRSRLKESPFSVHIDKDGLITIKKEN